MEGAHYVTVLLPHPDTDDRVTYHYHDQGYLENLTCRVTGRVDSRDPDDKVGWWLLFRGRSEDRGLAIRLWNTGEIEVVRVPQTGEDFPIPKLGPLRHRAIRTGKELNTLQVTLQGRKLSIAVNDVAVCEPITLQESLGPVNQGFGICQRGHGEARAEWSRFTLWELPPP
jgi:hypothetical protein